MYTVPGAYLPHASGAVWNRMLFQVILMVPGPHMEAKISESKLSHPNFALILKMHIRIH